MTEKSKVIFGNPMTVGTYNKAVKYKKKYAKNVNILICIHKRMKRMREGACMSGQVRI